MVGGGIEHSVEVCRLVSYCAAGGQEGIIGSRDLEVRARATPGAGVQVYPGACSILNRAPGVNYDMYATILPSIVQVNIAATGAAARTDMVIMRVENPYQPGEPWTRPSTTDVANNNVSFRRPAVISGVGVADRTVPTNLGYSAIPLARINLPPNTTAVQQSHITDLRQMTSVLSDTDEVMVNPAATSVLTSTVMAAWPTDVAAVLDVPRWATHLQARAIFSGIAFGSGTARVGGYDVNGRTEMMIGNEYVTQSTSYNLSNEGGTDYTTLMTGGRIAIPAAYRGTSRTLRTRGLKGTGSTSLTASAASTISITATWMQQPESNL
jgi:hypothetical protein